MVRRTTMNRPCERLCSCFKWLKRWVGVQPWTTGEHNPFRRTDAICDYDELNLGKRAQPNGLYSPNDIEEAARRFKANCGPAAFAALTRKPICSIMPFFPQFPEKTWTTKSVMLTAIQDANLTAKDCGETLPNIGVALLQILGPWSKIRLHPGAALSRTHWVAVQGENFYDINWDGWLPQAVWERLVWPSLRRHYCGAYGWKVRAGLEVEAHRNLGRTETLFGLQTREDLQPA